MSIIQSRRGQALRADARKTLRSACVEVLEARRLLSTIVWGNRGLASDNFDAAFGAGAPADAARTVVDAALDAWNRVVTNFNHADGIGPPDLVETISMNLGNAGFGGSTSTTIGADGKPTAGSVTINLGDSNGDGLSDWWVDPTPNDNSEFLGTINNAFTATAQAGSPASGRSDLYSVVLAELTHNMGIANAGAGSALYNTGGYTTDTGTADDAEGGGIGNFWLFQGPSVVSLMTNNNGGAGGSAATFPLHTAGPRANNAPLTFGGRTVFGVDDNGNAVGGGSQRTLVSNKTALILRDAFAYDIVMPETFGTFYAVLNQTTGLLTVRGAADNTVINGVNQGASSDQFSITRSGTKIVVSMNAGVDVPGTGSGFAANDQQDAFVSEFDAGAVTSIVVNAGGGNDSVTIDPLVGIAVTVNGDDGNDTIIGGGVAMTFNGGNGNDLLQGGSGADNLDGGDGDDTLVGDAGNDTLTGGANNDQIFGGTGSNTVTDGSGNDLIDLSANAVALVYTTGGGADTVLGSAFADLITGSSSPDNLFGNSGNDTLVGGGAADAIFGGDGSDTFVWNPGDGSDLVEGGAGDADVMAFNGSAGDETFTLNAVGSRFELLRNVGSIDMDVADVEQVNINDVGGDDTFNLNNLSGTGVTSVRFDLGSGDGATDTVVVNGTNLADNITASTGAPGVQVNGLPVSLLMVNADSEILVINGLGGDDQVTGFSPLETVMALTLDGGDGNDNLSAYATLLGGAGDDTLTGAVGPDTMEGGAGNDILFGLGGVDTLEGGDGNDTLVGGGGADEMFGDADDDLLVWNNGDGTDLMEGGAGADIVEVNGAAAGDNFTVGPNGARVAFARTNITPFALDIGTAERLHVNGLDGNDTISGGAGLAGLIILRMDGGNGNDLLTGGDGDDEMFGSAGNDSMLGMQGHDLLDGGAGADTQRGGDGDDTLSGGAGADWLYGDAGYDVLFWDRLDKHKSVGQDGGKSIKVDP